MSLKVTNYASKAYGTNSAAMPFLIPRQKFNFLLSMTLSDTQQTVQFDRVSDVSLPGYSFDTAIVNQYNKKRVVQTKLNYSAASVSFYDTFDSAFHQIVKRYMRHYYNNGTGIDTKRRPEDNVNNDSIDTSTVGYVVVPVDQRYLIPEINITQLGYTVDSDVVANRITKLINCMITDIRLDTLDYSSSEPVKFTVNFQPEIVTVVDQNNDAGA